MLSERHKLFFVEGDYVCFSWCRWHSNPLTARERFTKETSEVSGTKIDIHPTLKLAPGAEEKEKNIAPLTLEAGKKGNVETAEQR